MPLMSQLQAQNRTAFEAGSEIGGAYWKGKAQALKMLEQELRNRILTTQAKTTELEAKTFDQVMTENPLDQLKAVGSMPQDQIPGWLKQHASWRAIPQLSKMWDAVADSYSKSSEGIASTEYAKKRVGLALKYGLNPSTATEQDWSNATGNENVEEFIKESNAIGKDGSKVDFDPAKDFDANGNWLPGAKLRLLKAAPVSEAIRSRDEIARQQNLTAQNRIDALGMGGTRSFAPPELERMFDAAESEGQPFSDAAKNLAREIHAGIKPRARTSVPVISEENYVLRELPKLMATKPVKKVPGKWYGSNEVELTPEEAADSLRKQYRFITGPMQEEEETQPQTAAVKRFRIRDRATGRTGTSEGLTLDQIDSSKYEIIAEIP